MLEAPDRARRPSRHHEPAFAIEGHAVGVPRRVDQDRLADAGRPLPDGVADDVGPQEPLPAAIPDRAFTEGEAVGDVVERRIGADDPLQAAGRQVDVHCLLPAAHA